MRQVTLTVPTEYSYIHFLGNVWDHSEPSTHWICDTVSLGDGMAIICSRPHPSSRHLLVFLVGPAWHSSAAKPPSDATPISKALLGRYPSSIVVCVSACRHSTCFSRSSVLLPGPAKYQSAETAGATLRHYQLLQELFCTFFKIKLEWGHGLAVFWVPSEANLAITGWYCLDRASVRAKRVTYNRPACRCMYTASTTASSINSLALYIRAPDLYFSLCL